MVSVCASRSEILIRGTLLCVFTLRILHSFPLYQTCHPVIHQQHGHTRIVKITHTHTPEATCSV